ncbi:hypothetical protein GUB10_11970 [Salegentibacter sp. BLCTC]|uniref:hypothetical protein n=1 Tax=Salegentibacter sp. BLCTC TaxID=2697368 RepID=UPI00187B1B68|nr:hypothetical protein [Salegentibacter sp. BLCTC]MBE7641052.1 hypothetical protein [Salegentibacter sp. BLCTC]
MATIPTPTIHTFTEINPGKYASVKHYELDQVKNGNSLLSDKINIQKDRKFARSMPDYWLKKREGNKWSRPITGLFKTAKENIYKGDSNYKKHLIILKLAEDESQATVYYFQNFYTADLRHILPLIK